MADEKEDYQPAWRTDLHRNNETVEEHLITQHGKDPNEVYGLGSAACFELHDQLHEAVLGGTLVGGR